MKQTRKNRTNQTIVWPTTTFFTIRELHQLNPKFKEITLRVRLGNSIINGKTVEIGSIPGGKGRPQKVFSLTPGTKLMLDDAEKRGINLVDRARQNLVNVVSVSPTVAPTTTSAPAMVN
jgi:hypothetical protein